MKKNTNAKAILGWCAKSPEGRLLGASFCEFKHNVGDPENGLPREILQECLRERLLEGWEIVRVEMREL